MNADATINPDRHRRAGARANARMAAVQALYEIDMTDAATDPVLREFLARRWERGDEDMPDGQQREASSRPEPLDDEFFSEIVTQCTALSADIDPVIRRALSEEWPPERLEVLVRAILRAGAYELCHRFDVPAATVIDEYVEIANDFFSGPEPGLVNAVLDRIAHEVRSSEMNAGTPDAIGR